MFELYKVNAIYYFKRWLAFGEQKYKDAGLTFQYAQEEYCDTLYLETADKKGFVRIWPNYVVEEQIFTKNDDKSSFYLHFEVAHIAQCVYLFNEFYKVLIQKSEKRKYKVLVSCSGGLTSCLYSSKLQELADLRKYPIRIDAAAVTKLDSRYHDYDMILLAPQIGHEQADLKRQLGNEIEIIRINPVDYATLNLNESFDIICEAAKKKNMI